MFNVTIRLKYNFRRKRQVGREKCYIVSSWQTRWPEFIEISKHEGIATKVWSKEEITTVHRTRNYRSIISIGGRPFFFDGFYAFLYPFIFFSLLFHRFVIVSIATFLFDRYVTVRSAILVRRFTCRPSLTTSR